MIQLRDCALAVYVKNSKIVISEMFTNCLLKWFNAKFNSANLELSNSTKRKFEIENPIDWSHNRCCICTFPFEINAAKFDAGSKTMPHVDFIIFKEHKFLRNLFWSKDKVQLKKYFKR